MILACINGPWQATMLKASWIAAGYDNTPARTVLLAPHSSERFHRVTELLSRQSLFAEPVSAFDIFEEEEKRLNYAKLKKRLKKRFGTKKPDEVWISSVLNWREVAIASLYPDVPILLYEDGMQSCFKFSPGPENLTQKWQNVKVWAARIGAYNGYRRPWNVGSMIADRRSIRERVFREFAYAPRRLMGEDRGLEVTDENVAQSVLLGREVVAGGDMDETFGLTGRDCVFLGQCFAVLKTISEEQECQFYAQTMQRLLEKGMRVIWKEHPRTGGRYFKKIRTISGMSDIELFPAPPEVPVEFILTRENWSGVSVVGITSSSMLYLNEAFSVPCYFAGKAFRPYLDNVHQRMLDTFAGHFPDLKMLIG